MILREGWDGTSILRHCSPSLLACWEELYYHVVLSPQWECKQHHHMLQNSGVRMLEFWEAFWSPGWWKRCRLAWKWSLINHFLGCSTFWISSILKIHLFIWKKLERERERNRKRTPFIHRLTPQMVPRAISRLFYSQKPRASSRVTSVSARRGHRVSAVAVNVMNRTETSCVSPDWKLGFWAWRRSSFPQVQLKGWKVPNQRFSRDT